MIQVTRQPGLAPVVTIVDGLIFVSYGVPGALVLEVFTPTGALVKSATLPGGFFDSFPSLAGRWLAYKRDGDWKTIAVNVLDGQTFTFGEADGNWPLAVNDALGLVAFQQGREYAVFLGSLVDGSTQPISETGAPDGLSVLTDARTVVLRKDVRQSVPGMLYPVRAHDLTVGERQDAGIAVQLEGDERRVALVGQNTPTPSCACDGALYALVTGGPQGVRLLIGSRADVQALPAASSVRPSVPRIDRSIMLGWFHFGDAAETAPGNVTLQVDADMLVRDRATGAPLAVYAAGAFDSDVESLDAAIAIAARAHPDLPVLAYWTAQAQRVRLPIGAHLVGVECYCHVGESLDAFEQRVRGAVAVCPAAVLIAQAYTSNANNVADVASLVPVFARIARDCRNVVGVIGFSSGPGRATGYDAHPEAHEAWQQLAASVLGLPTLPQPPRAPVPSPKPTPPSPAPAPRPVPPAPTPLFSTAIPYKVPMTQKVALRLGQFFARIDPARAGKGPFGWFPVVFDRRDPSDPDCAFELSRPDGKLKVQHVTTGALLGADATEFSGDLASEFYGKPNEDRGGYESWDGWMLGGIPVIVISYDRDGQRYVSAGLTVVEL